MSPGFEVSSIVAVLIELASPFVLAAWLHYRLGASWRWWYYGMLVMFVFQGMLRMPLMLFIQSRSSFMDALDSQQFFIGYVLFAAMTAGLFEEGGRWLTIRFCIPPQHRTWLTGVMLGAGHGGLESIAVGLLSVPGLVRHISKSLANTPLVHSEDWFVLVAGWERVCAQAIHIAFALLVIQSFSRGARFWWYAVALHTCLNFSALMTWHLGSEHDDIGRNAARLLTGLLMTLFALIALAFIKHRNNG